MKILRPLLLPRVDGSAIRDFLRRELAPTPERWTATLRLVLACVAATIPIMMHKIPEGALVMLFIFLLTQEDTGTTILGSLLAEIGVTIGLGLALLVFVFAADIAWFRVCCMAAFFIGGLFLTRTCVVGPMGLAIGVPAAMAMVLPDILPIPELLVEFILWTWWCVTLGIAINLGVQLLLSPQDPRILLVHELSSRLHAVEDIVEQRLAEPESQTQQRSAPAISELALSGVARQLTLLRSAQFQHTSLKQYHVELNALISLVDRLVTAAAAFAALGPVPLKGGVRWRLRRIADECARWRRALEERRRPEVESPPRVVTPADVGTAVLLPLVEMERVLSLIPLALPGSAGVPTELQPTSEAKHLLVPDAFANPEYFHFAMKGALAGMICYVIFIGSDYPGIYTSVITCFVCSLSTIGASRYKGLLRLTGAAMGAVLGMVTLIYIFPHLDSLGGFWVPFAAGTAVAAYLHAGSPRIAYCGVQLGYAFYKTVLQGFGPVTSLKIARDRLLGIALGLLIFGIVEHLLWPVHAVDQLRNSFVNALRALARLAIVPNHEDKPAAILSKTYTLRLQLYQHFGTVQRLIEESKFEPGAVTRDPFTQAFADAQALFLLLLTVAQYHPTSTLRAVPEPVQAAVRRFNGEVAETLEVFARQIEGIVGHLLPNLDAALAEVAQTVETHIGGVVDSETVAQVRARLAVSCQLVPLVEQLVSHRTRLVRAEEGEPRAAVHEVPTQA